MKLTDFLDNVGRPIAYYPSMRKLTGSTTATILLCQFIYWRGKEADPDGWLYKTSEDIEKETGLSYNEQKTARRDLVEAGLLQEHYARLDHQMKFRLDINAINAKWGTLQGDIPESDKVTFGNDASPFSLNSNTETTTKNNTANAVLPTPLQSESWYQFEQAANTGESWEGRENLLPQHLPLADWYHGATGQTCQKRVQKAWMRALADWYASGLTVADLQAAYDADIKWRGVFTSPVELTAKAIALKAQGGRKTDEKRPAYNRSIPQTLERDL